MTAEKDGRATLRDVIHIQRDININIDSLRREVVEMNCRQDTKMKEQDIRINNIENKNARLSTLISVGVGILTFFSSRIFPK